MVVLKALSLSIVLNEALTVFELFIIQRAVLH
jgi:hypothetical protein